jgi:hypothetical protein
MKGKGMGGSTRLTSKGIYQMLPSQSRKKQNIGEKIPFVGLPRAVLMDKALKAGPKLVYGGLLMRACGKGRTFAGLDVIAEDLGLSAKTIGQHVQTLEARGLIKTKRRGMGQTFIRYIIPVEEVYENPRPSLGEQTLLTQAQNLPLGSVESSSTQPQNLPRISRRKEVKEEEVDEKKRVAKAATLPRPGPSEKRPGMVVGQVSPKLALSADLNGAADPEDKATALSTWKEFISRVVVAYPEFTPPPKPTLKVLGMVKNLLREFSIGNIRKLFDLTVKDWPAIKEKWPKLAKAFPTFYVAYTLRRDLMPLAQSGVGVTSRAHRVSKAAKKATKWGDVR